MTEIDRDKYPSNSIMGRNSKSSDGSQKIERVTSARVLKRRKSFAETVFGENASAVTNYILLDVLIPAAKSTISDMISNGIEMLLYGEPRRRGGRDRDRDKTYVSYSAYYGRDRDRDRDRGRDDDRDRGGRRKRFDDIVLETWNDADEVLNHLVDLIEEYDVATVANFYDLVGINGDYTDNKYGWDNLSKATIRRVRSGYVLDLPKPIVLD